MKKRFLITGKDSYIGTAVERYLIRAGWRARGAADPGGETDPVPGTDSVPETDPVPGTDSVPETDSVPQWEIDTISQRGDGWRQRSFSGVDVILHVTGIAHADTGKADDARRALYYRVNRDLAVETARKARDEGVGLFIFMSSMIVYGSGRVEGPGKATGRIDVHSPLNPEGFYGDSKKQAEEGLLALESEAFRVAILRPPMIYGPGSKGNYPLLARLAGRIPVFPDIHNERSVLYADNLAELVRQLAESGQGGIYHPQNEEYVTTSGLVAEIARAKGHRIRLCPRLNGLVYLAARMPGRIGRLTSKAFGSFSYDRGLSDGVGKKPYALTGFRESIERTEKGGGRCVPGSKYEETGAIPSAPRISLITVAYNSEKTLAKTIASVLAQDYGHLEYLIIDGASKDATLRVAESYRQALEKKGVRFRVISEPDRGIYDAMNKGIRLAEGDIIGIINSDDWYEPDAASCAAETFGTTGCDLMFADIRMHVRDGRSFVKKGRQRRFQTSRDWNHPTTFVRAGLYKAHPFCCLGIHDDYGFYLQMRKQGARIVTVNRVLANFRMGGASNRKSLKEAIGRIRDRYLYCYRRNGYSRWYILECVAIEAAKLVLG